MSSTSSTTLKGNVSSPLQPNVIPAMHPDDASAPDDPALVSVVMIAYNKEKYIEDAIKGVVKQAKALRRIGFDLELIIMDDCSDDATPSIIARYHKLYPGMIRPVRNDHNLGLQGNYLAGFPLCRGRYMAICDADDYWFYGSKLATQIKYMEEHRECAITFHRMVNLYEETGEMSLSNGGTPSHTDIRQLSLANYITNSSVVYRRKLVDLTSLPEWMHRITSPDYAMHMFYASKGDIRFFGRPMGVYRKASGSAWSMTDNMKRLEMALDVRRYLTEWLGTNHPEAKAGLEKSSSDITKAMDNIKSMESASSDIAESHVRKRLLSRIRGAVSRLLPRPRP